MFFSIPTFHQKGAARRYSNFKLNYHARANRMRSSLCGEALSPWVMSEALRGRIGLPAVLGAAHVWRIWSCLGMGLQEMGGYHQGDGWGL